MFILEYKTSNFMSVKGSLQLGEFHHDAYVTEL